MDSTWTIRLFTKKMNSAALVIACLLAALFLAAGYVVLRYSRVRHESTLASAVADEARKSEAEARDMAKKLQQFNEDVVKLNRELEDNMQKLSDAREENIRKGKLAQLGQLTATVAHEIRNPLNSVQASAYIVNRKFRDTNPGMEKPMDRILNGIARCDRIITELLDFTRTSKLDLQDRDLDSWLTEIVEEQAERLPPEVAIECQLGLDGGHVQFDAGRLSRAMINFLNNASEAMVGKKDHKPEHPTLDPKIVVATRTTSRGVEISVTDNGPGISEEVMAKSWSRCSPPRTSALVSACRRFRRSSNSTVAAWKSTARRAGARPLPAGSQLHRTPDKPPKAR